MAKKVNQGEAAKAASTLASNASTRGQKATAARRLSSHKEFHPHKKK